MLLRGAAGEIVVTEPHVLPGYLDGVGDEETKFDVDGTRWHRTGDAGRLDEEGCLWLLGRCHARIDAVIVLDAIPVDRRHNAKIDDPTLKAELDARRA